MARLSKTLLDNVSGGIGKEVVFKQYKDKKVVTGYPDMRNVKPSKQQKQQRSLFADAVAYAQNINRNPEKKAAYLKKVQSGESVYHFAVKEYLAAHKK